MHAYLTGRIDRPAAELQYQQPPSPPSPPPPTTSISHFYNQPNTAQAQSLEQPPPGTATVLLAGVGRNHKMSPVWQHLRLLGNRIISQKWKCQVHGGHKVTFIGTSPWARSTVQGILHVQPGRPCSGKEENNIHCPFPPRKEILTVPSQPKIIHPLSRPAPPLKRFTFLLKRPFQSHFQNCFYRQTKVKTDPSRQDSLSHYSKYVSNNIDFIYKTQLVARFLLGFSIYLGPRRFFVSAVEREEGSWSWTSRSSNCAWPFSKHVT